MSPAHARFVAIVSDFLKLRDESVGPDEATDEERTGSAEYMLEILRVKCLDIVEDNAK